MKRKVLTGLAVVAAALAIALIAHSNRPATRASTSTRPPSDPSSLPRSIHNMGIERDDARGDLVLEGQVLDSDDEPVGGVSVSLDAFPPQTMVTESDGSFSFTGLIERSYRITAVSPSGVAGPVAVSLQRTTDPVILHLVGPGSVVVRVVDAASQTPIAGARVEIRTPIPVTGQTGPDGAVELSPVVHGHWDVVGTATGRGRGHSAVVVGAEQSTTTIALEQGGSLRGRVVDDRGHAVHGARVWAVSSSDWTDNSSPELDGASTDEDGRFELAALQPGTYRIHGRAHGFADTASRELTLSDSITDAGDLVMNAGATLRGRVVRRNGTAVPGAEVEVYIETGLAPKTHAGSDGAFVIDDLPRANVLVTARGDGASCWAKRVDLSSGSGETTLTLDLEGWLAGSVVDSSGAPVEDAVVAVSLIQPGARFVRRNMTDGGGTFRFAGLPDGDYDVEAMRPGVTTSARHPKVTRHTGESVQLVLEATGSIKGQVEFADGSSPSVVVVRAGAGGAPHSFPNGDIAMSGIAPGSYELRIEGPEIASAPPTTAVVAEGKTTDLGTIRAERGRAINGVVVDKDGRPVAGAEVVAGTMIVGTGATVDSGSRAPAFQAELKHATTSSDGTFVLRGLAPIALSIVASHPKAGRSAPLTLPADATASLRIALAPTSSLSGTVTSGGHPVSAGVIAQPAASPLALALVFSGADGTFHYDNLASGRYSVSAVRGDPFSGAPLSPVAVDLAPGSKAHVDVQAFRGTRSLDVSTAAAGVVFVSTEAIAPKTALELLTQLGQQTRGHWAMTRSDGHAHFSLLAPVAYTACVAALDGTATDLTTMLREITVAGSTIPVTCRPASATATSLAVP